FAAMPLLVEAASSRFGGPDAATGLDANSSGSKRQDAASTSAGREMFASSDDWCRPVFLTAGPDGALYVCDMYRKIIEHPDYLPAEIRKHSNFNAGKTMGRIWRITSSAGQKEPLPEKVDLGLEREDVGKAPLDQ